MKKKKRAATLAGSGFVEVLSDTLVCIVVKFKTIIFMPLLATQIYK
jgi:hypothetical protein